jgi:streptomycin 3"-adenylyltransferase
MSEQQDGWRANVIAPPEIKQQLDYFARSLCEIEGDNLIGVYLHGSLAMDCFQPQRSDVDLLVLVDQPPLPARRREWAQEVLRASAAPGPIEISFLHRSQYTPWRYPTPFSFHFSEEWRPRISQELQDGSWQGWNWDNTPDPDLAAHFTVTRRRGVCLAGAPVAEAIPLVPWAHYLNSILADFTWACERAGDNPVYLALNACRVWAAVEEQLVLSKQEGAGWAQPRLAAELAAIVARAAADYAGQASAEPVEPVSGEEALRVAQWIGAHLKKASS